MAIEREATLRKAEKFLRVGRIEAAIAEYARVVEEQPRDWTTANTLGDLYLRTGQSDKAVGLYQQIADHLLAEGFFPKAGALLKKILKIRPDDESALVHLGEIAARQGLMAEARGYYTTVATRRSSRGDAAGADELMARLGTLEAGQLLPLIATELTAGDLERATSRFPELLRSHPDPRAALLELAGRLLPGRVAAASACVDAAVDHAVAAGEHAVGAEILERFIARVPGHIPSLLRLIEVGVDGDLDSVVHTAQAQLADAYLANGRADEARVIAEDLVTRDRTDLAHVERLRRALEMLQVADVEAAMAERMSGSAHDPLEFFEDEYTAPAPEGTATADEDDPVVAEILSLGHPARVTAADTVTAPATPTPIPTPDEQPEPPRPAPSSIPEIDLTGALIDLQAGKLPAPIEPVPAPELEDVFAGLRADAAADPAEDESEDYVSLARTYLEIGLRDDGIAALLIAVKSPRKRFACAAMLARLYRDNGDIPQAIEWYERAAEAPPTTPEDGRTLMYELGDLLETVGETARALAVFLEVDAETSGFLDVAARIRRLSTDQVGG